MKKETIINNLKKFLLFLEESNKKILIPIDIADIIGVRVDLEGYDRDGLIYYLKTKECLSFTTFEQEDSITYPKDHSMCNIINLNKNNILAFIKEINDDFPENKKSIINPRTILVIATEIRINGKYKDLFQQKDFFTNNKFTKIDKKILINSFDNYKSSVICIYYGLLYYSIHQPEKLFRIIEIYFDPIFQFDGSQFQHIRPIEKINKLLKFDKYIINYSDNEPLKVNHHSGYNNYKLSLNDRELKINNITIARPQITSYGYALMEYVLTKCKKNTDISKAILEESIFNFGSKRLDQIFWNLNVKDTIKSTFFNKISTDKFNFAGNEFTTQDLIERKISIEKLDNEIFELAKKYN